MTAEAPALVRTPRVSADGVYRHRSSVTWADGEALPVVLLHPPLAEVDEDGTGGPQVEWLTRYAARLGFGTLGIWWLYALRAEEPSDLLTHSDPAGPGHDQELAWIFTQAVARGLPVVAAWGVGAQPDRVKSVCNLPGARDALHHLGLTRGGSPRSPDRSLSLDTVLIQWSGSAPAITAAPPPHPAPAADDADEVDDADYLRFLDIVRADAQAHDGRVDPNRVRADLAAAITPPQRIGAMYRIARERDPAGVRRAVLDDPIETTSTDTTSGNAGKPIRTYRFNDPEPRP